ncbi:hypothetical protein ACHAWF_008575 [Thalassiosira exigua]
MGHSRQSQITLRRQQPKDGRRTHWRVLFETTVLIGLAFFFISWTFIFISKEDFTPRAFLSKEDFIRKKQAENALSKNKVVSQPNLQEQKVFVSKQRHAAESHPKQVLRTPPLSQTKNILESTVSSDYNQVFEDFLPPESLHQEGASCRVGTKLYLIGGSFGTLHDVEILKEKEMDIYSFMEDAALGHGIVTIYDMKDMSTRFGPRLPYRANHITCAKAPDGVTLHVTGGFNQDAEDKSEGAHCHHYTLNTSLDDDTWQKKEDMPLCRGAHGCEYLSDGRMYCVGGGIGQYGPFRGDLMIYAPSKDYWEMGPPMPTPRDHIYETVVAIKEGTQLYVAGGRTEFRDLQPDDANPKSWGNTNVVEIYDINTRVWVQKRNLLNVRPAIGVVPYYRNGPAEDEEPNLLLVGGENFQVFSGFAYRIVEEYHVESDLYYCLMPLTWPYYGGALGVHNGKLHIVGGAEWMGLSATRRVQVYDLEKAPPPRQCFYEPRPIFDQWDRSWNKAKPYPDLGDTSSDLAELFEWFE